MQYAEKMKDSKAYYTGWIMDNTSKKLMYNANKLLSVKQAYKRNAYLSLNGNVPCVPAI